MASVVLASADVSVVNRTTLSLWHFQQLAHQLLPTTQTVAGESGDGGIEDADESNDAESPVDDESESPSQSKQLQDTTSGERSTARKHMELGEGMSVAAILYEPDNAESSESESESDDEASRELLEDSDAENEFHAESAVAAMVASSTDSRAAAADDDDDDGTMLSGARLTPTSEVGVVYKRYRCVVCLDASPSTLSIDPATGRLFLDMLYESVEVSWGIRICATFFARFLWSAYKWLYLLLFRV